MTEPNGTKTFNGTFDPAKGVGFGWTNMSVYEMLIAVELMRHALLKQIAPDAPILSAGPTASSSQVRAPIQGRRVDYEARNPY